MMRVLLDECLPRRLKYTLLKHEVFTVPEAGWSGRKNGELLRLAEQSFDVFITADQNIQYQQNLHSTRLGIVVLIAPNNRFETLHPLMAHVQTVLETIAHGDLIHLP
jgi:predicted nuclease of predicted toxin-antitoxin system